MTDIDIPALLDYRPEPGAFNDRVILVTGAAAGIGRAIAQACAAAGAIVVLLDKDIKGLEKTYDLIEQEGHPQPAIYPLNLEGATVKDYGDLAENIRDSLGRLDGLVLHAGWAGTLTPMKGYDPELWFKVINSNLHGPFFLAQAVLPLLEASPHGSLVVSTQDCRKAFWGAFGMSPRIRISRSFAWRRRSCHWSKNTNWAKRTRSSSSCASASSRSSASASRSRRSGDHSHQGRPSSRARITTKRA